MKQRHSIIPASFLVLKKENKVLLLKRFNTGYEDGKYSLIAGHVDPGETFSQTIIREAEEEAGIFLLPENIDVTHVMHENSGTEENAERVNVFFEAKKRDGHIVNKEPHKCDDLSRFDLDALPDNIIPCIKHALHNIKHGVFYSEFGR